MKFLILKKEENFTPFFFHQNFHRFTFFWWHYLIKGGKKLFYKITSKSYVLGLGNQCVTPENR